MHAYKSACAHDSAAPYSMAVEVAKYGYESHRSLCASMHDINDIPPYYAPSSTRVSADGMLLEPCTPEREETLPPSSNAHMESLRKYACRHPVWNSVMRNGYAVPYNTQWMHLADQMACMAHELTGYITQKSPRDHAVLLHYELERSADAVPRERMSALCMALQRLGYPLAHVVHCMKCVMHNEGIDAEELHRVFFDSYRPRR